MELLHVSQGVSFGIDGGQTSSPNADGGVMSGRMVESSEKRRGDIAMIEAPHNPYDISSLLLKVSLQI